jgi:fructokinase
MGRAMILVAGEALYDLFVEGEQGNTLSLEARPGGSPFNVAVGLARLSQPVGFFGGVSQDFLGQRLLRLLEAEGIDARFVRHRRQPTTLSLVGLAPNGSPAYGFYGEGADRAIDAAEIPPLPAGLRALHLGSYSTVAEPVGTALESLLRRNPGIPLVSYDPNVRLGVEPDIWIWRRKFASLLPFVHLLKISLEDFKLLFPGADSAELAGSWLKKGPRLVVITRGPEGAQGFTAAATAAVPATAVSVVDTVGAGDSYQAALLAGLAEAGRLDADSVTGLSAAGLGDLLAFAGAAAAITCSRRGADMPRRAELPPHDALDRFFRSPRPK